MDYHSDRFEDFSLMVYKDEKLIALLPANTVGSSVFSHQGLTYGGLIYSENLKTKDAILMFQSVMQFLFQNGIKNLMIKELPFIYLENLTNNPLNYLLFKSKAELIRTDMHSVAKVKNAKFSNSRKEGYKRGLKHDLKVEESESFETFWNEILVPNLRKKHNIEPTHSLEEISLLKSKFEKNIRQFNVYHNDKIVGGTTIFETNNLAHCQYISGNEDKNELGSLDFLHIQLIENIYKDKRYFNFGTSNINAGQNINEGLQFWKEGFGARSITQGFYNVETKNHKLFENVLL
ncbi:GNAT family N-acetyltransferase [Winogradskyella ursingii]|uniref:GNAT family N-acetyltransferase n=1 Tax=Winogradskyella ursingii TaxID=2686079 RepID=UPI0015C6F1F3|nr:GNAT family N-acetyltransferase [Winogradskyella ursingii]